MSFTGLTPGVILQESHVARLALALKGSDLVDAHLGANARSLTLIDVHTGVLIGAQFIAIVALAAVTHLQIHTLVHTAAILRGALVDATLSGRLILAIRAVLPAVADLGIRDAQTTAAIEFSGCIASPWRRTNVAHNFITAIRTVPLPVAGQMAGDAALIVALELIRTTGHF